MRVVGNGAQQQRRRSDRVTIDAVAEVVPATVAAGASAAAPARLPLLPALFFLLACIGGGVAVALLAPLVNG